jgi:hypothetical protein
MPNKAMLVACPTCEVPIGVACKKQRGRYSPEWWSHRARVDLARQPGATDEGRQMAIDGMQSFIRSKQMHPFECCDMPFADLQALERHQLSGHGGAVALGLVPTQSGWSSR